MTTVYEYASLSDFCSDALLVFCNAEVVSSEGPDTDPPPEPPAPAGKGMAHGRKRGAMAIQYEFVVMLSAPIIFSDRAQTPEGVGVWTCRFPLGKNLSEDEIQKKADIPHGLYYKIMEYMVQACDLPVREGRMAGAETATLQGHIDVDTLNNGRGPGHDNDGDGASDGERTENTDGSGVPDAACLAG